MVLSSETKRINKIKRIGDEVQMIQCECGLELFPIDVVAIKEENNELLDVYRCPKCFQITYVKRNEVV